DYRLSGGDDGLPAGHSPLADGAWHQLVHAPAQHLLDGEAAEGGEPLVHAGVAVLEVGEGEADRGGRVDGLQMSEVAVGFGLDGEQRFLEANVLVDVGAATAVAQEETGRVVARLALVEEPAVAAVVEAHPVLDFERPAGGKSAFELL